MKKIVTIAILALGLWMLSKSNDFAVWFNADHFYSPIAVKPFDIMDEGFTVRLKLDHQYDVRHGFSLVFPCTEAASGLFSDLDGEISYRFLSNGAVISEQSTSIPTHPMWGSKKGICRIVLFTFDLPYPNTSGNTFVEVTLTSPINDLKDYNGSIECQVAPAYWPK